VLSALKEAGQVELTKWLIGIREKGLLHIIVEDPRLAPIVVEHIAFYERRAARRSLLVLLEYSVDPYVAHQVLGAVRRADSRASVLRVASLSRAVEDLNPVGRAVICISSGVLSFETAFVLSRAAERNSVYVITPPTDPLAESYAIARSNGGAVLVDGVVEGRALRAVLTLRS